MEPILGTKLSQVMEICRGLPVKYHTKPRMMINPPGMKVPKTTLTELIHPEIFIPSKLASVAPQKEIRIMERVNVVLFAKVGSKI